MINDEEFQENFKIELLNLEKENLSNITKIDDRQMVARIIRIYEETKNDNK